MIVVSGVLVFVALIFLIIGLAGEGLLMIWLSIGTSVVAGVFLLLGALQRRGAPAPAAEGGATSGDMLERVTAVSVRPREGDAAAAPTEADEAAPAAAGGGEVAVVPGRPRYHVSTCRFLAGRPDVETVAVEQARSEGYTACGVCKPDAALAAAESAPEPEPAAEEPAAEETAPLEVLPEPPAVPAKKAAAKRTRTAAATASKAATATLDAPADEPAEAAPAPAKPAKKAAAKTAAAAKSTAGASQVVVIPDRGKFHQETCRFVKDVPGTVTLSKAAAKRQGYVGCGVCKP